MEKKQNIPLGHFFTIEGKDFIGLRGHDKKLSVIESGKVTEWQENEFKKSVAPPHEDKGAEEILNELFYKPETQDWYKPVLKAMQEYASNERNRAIGEVAEIAAKFFEGSHLKRINEELSKLKDLTIPTKK